MKIVVSIMAALLAVAVVGRLAAATPAPNVRLVQAEAAFERACAEAESVRDDDSKAQTLESIAEAQAKIAEALLESSNASEDDGP